MKIAKWILIVAGVFVAVFLVGAALIDPVFRVERSATIDAPAGKIYPLIAAPKAWTRWTVWNEREPSGPESGQGARWDWEVKDGKNPMMRWFAPFMDRMMGPDFEGGLRNLKALAEKP